jgi:hypothetical protein
MALLITAGVLGQMRMGYFDFEIGLDLRILFGLQLIDYVLQSHFTCCDLGVADGGSRSLFAARP